MIKIGICDDEKIVLRVLKKIIQKCMEEMEVENKIITFDSGKGLLKAIKELDILFLDINMPQLDGIEVGEKICEQGIGCKIIIASCMVERFKETFKINAFRFVTKPFKEEEIKESLGAALKTRIGLQKIELYRDRNLYEFFQKEILYMKAVNSAVEFVLRNGVFRRETSLSELDNILDEKLFYRINRQYIVNIGEVEQYKNGKIQICGIEMEVSIRKRKKFQKIYTLFDIDY